MSPRQVPSSQHPWLKVRVPLSPSLPLPTRNGPPLFLMLQPYMLPMQQSLICMPSRTGTVANDVSEANTMGPIEKLLELTQKVTREGCVSGTVCGLLLCVNPRRQSESHISSVSPPPRRPPPPPPHTHTHTHTHSVSINKISIWRNCRSDESVSHKYPRDSTYALRM